MIHQKHFYEYRVFPFKLLGQFIISCHSFYFHNKVTKGLKEIFCKLTNVTIWTPLPVPAKCSEPLDAK